MNRKSNFLNSSFWLPVFLMLLVLGLAFMLALVLQEVGDLVSSSPSTHSSTPVFFVDSEQGQITCSPVETPDCLAGSSHSLTR